MSLGSYESEVGRGSLLNALAHPSVVNPAAAIGAAAQTAGAITDLRAHQFALQQAQLQPVYSAMRMLQATNPDPTEDQFLGAIGAGARNGGNPDSTVANYTAWKAQNPNGKPGDFLRGLALGGMSPSEQAQYSYPQRQNVQTAAGLYSGTSGALAGPTPGQFAPSSFVAQGVSPEWAATRIPIVGPDGKVQMVPQGALMGSGGGAAGGGGTGAGAAVNNFGNIRAPGGGFASFNTPQDGIAAMTGLLASYQDQQGINTLNGITARWAPKGDGANDPVAYANTVAKLTGLDPNAPLNLHDPATLAKIIPAMAQVEHGRPMIAPGDVLNAGISAGLGGRAGAPSQGAPGGPQSGAFVGATSAQPVASGGPVAPSGAGAGANVRPAGGGVQYIPASPGGGGGGGAAAIPGVGAMTPYGAVLTPPAPGTVESIQKAAEGSTQRQQALETQMNAAVTTRATLEGMETELGKLPSTGVATGALSTLKNLLVQSGGLSQQELDRQSQGLAAQEQFDKFSSLLNQQLLSGMGGQATDARQELTGAATPSSVHSVLGNLGIIHMLEGNLIATQVMGREFRATMNAGQATPAQFDAWRDSFTKPGPNGARFDPRVFWIASMQPQEQQTYINSLNAKDRAQLLKNSNYAETKGWVFEDKDGSMKTGY